MPWGAMTFLVAVRSLRVLLGPIQPLPASRESPTISSSSPLGDHLPTRVLEAIQANRRALRHRHPSGASSASRPSRCGLRDGRRTLWRSRRCMNASVASTPCREPSIGVVGVKPKPACGFAAIITSRRKCSCRMPILRHSFGRSAAGPKVLGRPTRATSCPVWCGLQPERRYTAQMPAEGAIRRPCLTTRERAGWATTASPIVSAGTRVRSAWQPGSRP